MANLYDIVAWQDFAMDRHEGPPSEGALDDVHGVLVIVENSQTGETEYFWTFALEALEDWDDWYDLIESMMEMYGMPVGA